MPRKDIQIKHLSGKSSFPPNSFISTVAARVAYSDNSNNLFHIV